jgi:protein MpaA
MFKQVHVLRLDALTWHGRLARAGHHQCKSTLIVFVGITAGCVAHEPSHAFSHSPTTHPVVEDHKTMKTIIGQSVEARPIEMFRFGNDPSPVLVIAAIHGDEPTSKYVADRLIERLGADRGADGIVIPCANPDGLAADRRVNAHGVDLNRNFPAANWKRTHPGRTYGGAEAGSEPETAALLAILTSLKPRLIISIHSMDNPCDNFDGPAEPIAQLMSKYNHYPVRDNIGYPTPGSLGSWAGIDRGIPIITLELPRHQAGEAAWRDNCDALLATLRPPSAMTATSPSRS